MEGEIRRLRDERKEWEAERARDGETRDGLETEIRQLKGDVDGRERGWASRLREMEERWRVEEEERRGADAARIKALQREVEQLKADASIRVEEHRRRVEWLTQEKAAEEQRRVQVEGAFASARVAWEGQLLQVEQSMSASSRAMRESLQSQLKVVEEGRMGLLAQLEKERADSAQRVQQVQAEVARLQEEKVKWEGERVTMEGSVRSMQVEVEQTKAELKREREERREEVESLLQQQGEQWRRAEERWREVEEERKRLAKRVEEVEREKEKRDSALHSAMTALQVSMQQMGYASDPNPTVSFPFPSLAQAALRPLTPAPPAAQLRSSTPTPGPLSSPSVQPRIVVASPVSGGVKEEVRGGGVTMTSGVVKEEARRVVASPTAPAVLKVREEVKEVEVELDDEEWEREMRAEMASTPLRLPQSTAAGKRVSRVADSDDEVEVEVEYSEDEGKGVEVEVEVEADDDPTPPPRPRFIPLRGGGAQR